MSAFNFKVRGCSPTNLAHDVPLFRHDKLYTGLGGTTLLKFMRAKNVQNLVHLTTTFEFDCEYLWTE